MRSQTIRILYDISTLGLGHVYAQSRGGSYRADQHRAEGLIASGECDLLFCANHSSVAYQGCLAYLRTNAELRDVPLIGPRPTEGTARLQHTLRGGAAAAHRWARAIVGSNELPRWLRRSGTMVDRRLHPAVFDASPPVDIFHSSAPLPRPRRGRSPLRFLTIYDMSYTRFPAIYGPAYAQAAHAMLNSIHGDDWVITCSNASRSELCESGRVAPHQVLVSSLAADRRIFHPRADADRVRAVRDALGIPDGPYILSVNSGDPRKNIARAVRAFGRIVDQEGVRDLTYVLIGHAGPRARHVVEHAGRSAAVGGRLRLTGYVADEDLAPLYHGASAFVYPSIYEGFGLPPLEAMQCGTPVIASNTSSLPEVVGDAGLLVNPEDDEAVADAMLKVCRDAALRQRMRAQSLAQAARFSWERGTQETLLAYRTALAR